MSAPGWFDGAGTACEQSLRPSTRRCSTRLYTCPAALPRSAAVSRHSANTMTSSRTKGHNVSTTRRSGATRVSSHVVGSFDGWVPIAGTARTARLDQVQAAAPCTPEESPAESWMPPSTTTNAPIQGRANYVQTSQKDSHLARLCRVSLAIGPLALIAREPCCLLPCVCVAGSGRRS